MVSVFGIWLRKCLRIIRPNIRKYTSTTRCKNIHLLKMHGDKHTASLISVVQDFRFIHKQTGNKNYLITTSVFNFVHHVFIWVEREKSCLTINYKFRFRDWAAHVRSWVFLVRKKKIIIIYGLYTIQTTNCHFPISYWAGEQAEPIPCIIYILSGSTTLTNHCKILSALMALKMAFRMKKKMLYYLFPP